MLQGNQYCPGQKRFFAEMIFAESQSTNRLTSDENSVAAIFIKKDPTLLHGAFIAIGACVVLGGGTDDAENARSPSASTYSAVEARSTAHPTTFGDEIISWIGAQPGAFSELDAKRAEDFDFLKLVDEIRKAQIIPEHRKLADRLGEMLADYKIDYDGKSLEADSLSGLFAFLKNNAPVRLPKLTATPRGNIYAKWGRSQRDFASVEFLPSGDARYVVFKPNPTHPGRTDRRSGFTTNDCLLSEIGDIGYFAFV